MVVGSERGDGGLIQVRYIGKNPTLHKGAKALMREDGKVQLDGGKDAWRASYTNDPRCYGWHDLGGKDDWELVE